MLGLCVDIQYRKTWRHLAASVYLFFLIPLFIPRSRGSFCWGGGASRGPISNLKLESRGSGLLPREGWNRSSPSTLPQHSRYLCGFSLGTVLTNAREDTATGADWATGNSAAVSVWFGSYRRRVEISSQTRNWSSWSWMHEDGGDGEGM
jgi:hypothetical protein